MGTTKSSSSTITGRNTVDELAALISRVDEWLDDARQVGASVGAASEDLRHHAQEEQKEAATEATSEDEAEERGSAGEEQAAQSEAAGGGRMEESEGWARRSEAVQGGRDRANTTKAEGEREHKSKTSSEKWRQNLLKKNANLISGRTPR